MVGYLSNTLHWHCRTDFSIVGMVLEVNNNRFSRSASKKAPFLRAAMVDVVHREVEISCSSDDWLRSIEVPPGPPGRQAPGC